MAVVVVMMVMVMIMMMVVMIMVVVVVIVMVVVVMHSKILLADFFLIIIAGATDVKVFIFADYPPGTVAPEGKKCYNNPTEREEARAMSDRHFHTHENQKAVVNRLARAIGHLSKVKRMVEEGHDCADILVQLAAVRSAIDNTGKVILNDHIRHCMVDAVQLGDESAIDGLCEAIEKFMK